MSAVRRRLAILLGEARSEEGFTLVEMMMALLVLGVALVALASVFNATLQISGIAASRARAFALAQRDVEAFKGLPYCDVGYTTPPTAAPQVASTTWTDPNDSQSYSVANPYGNPNPQEPAPSSTVLIAGRTFNISRMVVWAGSPNDNGSGGPERASAYKRVVETVQWTDRAASPHTVRQDGNVYPGALGPYAAQNCGAFTSVGSGTPPNAVTGFTATPDVSSPSSTIDLSWTNPTGGCNCDTYRVAYSFNGWATS